MKMRQASNSSSSSNITKIRANTHKGDCISIRQLAEQWSHCGTTIIRITPPNMILRHVAWKKLIRGFLNQGFLSFPLVSHCLSIIYLPIWTTYTHNEHTHRGPPETKIILHRQTYCSATLHTSLKWLEYQEGKHCSTWTFGSLVRPLNIVLIFWE